MSYSRARSDAERTAAECSKLGVRALPFKADVGDDAACRALAEVSLRRPGQQIMAVTAIAPGAITARYLKQGFGERYDAT